MSDKSKASSNTTSDSIDVETLTNMVNALPVHADELKQKFSAGAVPLEGHFRELIEAIYMALAAVGLDPDSRATGKGLQVNDNKLEVKTTGDASGLTVGDEGVAVDIETIQPKLTMGEGITQTGATIAVDTTIIQGKLSASWGLKFSTNGKTLELDTFPFGQEAGSYIHVLNANGNGLHLSVLGTQFETETPNGYNHLNIKSGLLNVDGMIQMFSGGEVPEGWALCDGKASKITGRKTPDLCSMFINESKGGAGDGLVYVINETGYSDALVKNIKMNDGEIN